MHKEYILFFKSCGAGLFTFITVLTLGYIFDLFINVKLSNILAVFIGLIVNYMMQERIFTLVSKKQHYIYKITKYIITDIIILLFNSLLFNKLIDLKKNLKFINNNKFLSENYPTICRIIVGIIIWVFLSYPLRRYIIF